MIELLANRVQWVGRVRRRLAAGPRPAGPLVAWIALLEDPAARLERACERCLGAQREPPLAHAPAERGAWTEAPLPAHESDYGGSGPGIVPPSAPAALALRIPQGLAHAPGGGWAAPRSAAPLTPPPAALDAASGNPSQTGHAGTVQPLFGRSAGGRLTAAEVAPVVAADRAESALPSSSAADPDGVGSAPAWPGAPLLNAPVRAAAPVAALRPLPGTVELPGASRLVRGAAGLAALLGANQVAPAAIGAAALAPLPAPAPVLVPGAMSPAATAAPPAAVQSAVWDAAALPANVPTLDAILDELHDRLRFEFLRRYGVSAE